MDAQMDWIYQAVVILNSNIPINLFITGLSHFLGPIDNLDPIL